MIIKYNKLREILGIKYRYFVHYQYTEKNITYSSNAQLIYHRKIININDINELQQLIYDEFGRENAIITFYKLLNSKGCD